jgi:hypothetical protein
MVLLTRTVWDPVLKKRRRRTVRELNALATRCNAPPITIAWGKPRVAGAGKDAAAPRSEPVPPASAGEASKATRPLE